MKRAVSWTGLTLTLAPVMALAGPAEAASSTGVPPALARAAADYDRAQAAGDRVALERLLAPDYTLVNGAPEVEDKAALIADFTDPAFKLEPFRVENAVVRVWPGAAILAGEVHLHGTNRGKPFVAHIRFADVWRLRSGHWQVVFTQVTRFGAGT